MTTDMGAGLLRIAIGGYLLWLGGSTVVKIIPKLIGRNGTYGPDAAAQSPNKRLVRYGIVAWAVLLALFVAVSLSVIGYGVVDHFKHKH